MSNTSSNYFPGQTIARRGINYTVEVVDTVETVAGRGHANLAAHMRTLGATVNVYVRRPRGTTLWRLTEYTNGATSFIPV
jgi:hypothetical protein